MLGVVTHQVQVALGLVRQVRRVFFEEDAREPVNRPQRGTQVVRDRVRKRFQFAICLLQLFGT